MTTLIDGITNNWHVWFVTITLIVAAVIDGIKLKVPNWITYPMIISGWVYSMAAASAAGDTWYQGLGASLIGTLVGLALLLPAYAIGGMGAGDVKLLAGVGAWMHGSCTAYAFACTTITGAVLSVLMVVHQKAWDKHRDQFWMIVNEIVTIRNPEQLSEIAAKRKSSMRLLPYGIPIAIGTIVYFAWMNMLV